MKEKKWIILEWDNEIFYSSEILNLLPEESCGITYENNEEKLIPIFDNGKIKFTNLKEQFPLGIAFPIISLLNQISKEMR